MGFKKTLKGIFLFLDRRMEEVALVILGIILVASLTFSVIVRYAIHHPAFTMASHWAEEIAKYSFIWLLYMGASLATRNGGHFKVTAQFGLLPQAAKKYASLPGDFVWLIFNLLLIKLGFDLCRSSAESSLSLELPMKYVYAIIPISFVLILFRLIQYNYQKLRVKTPQ
jgi:TRAP-type C4-dicarboxylate transport system permease small subunit